MIPDELDIFILKEIFNAYQKGEEANNWEIAKKYAKIKKGTDDNNIINSNFYRMVKLRLNHYCRKGIFFKSKNSDGSVVYNMNLDRVTFSRHKFSDGFSQCLIIRCLTIKKI